MTKVIIVDDDHAAQQRLVQTVESMGHTAIRCSSAEMALERLSENPDTLLVITDVDSTSVAGDHLMGTMRVSEELQAIPIVATTRTARMSDSLRILVMGASTCIRKPLDSEEIEACVMRYLGFGLKEHVPSVGRQAPAYA